MPVARECLYPAEDQPRDEKQQIEPEHVVEDELYDAHWPALLPRRRRADSSRQPRAWFVAFCLTLIEESSFRDAGLVLGGHLDVRRGQQEHLVGHSVDAPA